MPCSYVDPFRFSASDLGFGLRDLFKSKKVESNGKEDGQLHGNWDSIGMCRIFVRILFASISNIRSPVSVCSMSMQ